MADLYRIKRTKANPDRPGARKGLSTVSYAVLLGSKGNLAALTFDLAKAGTFAAADVERAKAYAADRPNVGVIEAVPVESAAAKTSAKPATGPAPK